METPALPGEALVEGGQRLVYRPAGDVRSPVVRQHGGHVDRGPDAVAERTGPHAIERAPGGLHGLPAVAPKRGHLSLGLRPVHPPPARAASRARLRQLELGLRELPVTSEKEGALQPAVPRHEAEAEPLGLALAALEPLERRLVLAKVPQHQHHHREQVRQAAIAIVTFEHGDGRVQPRKGPPRSAGRRLDPHPRQRSAEVKRPAPSESARSRSARASAS